MSNEKPSISVVIATYNYLNSLKLCLASLERQSFTNFEILIADDGSGPEVGDWLKLYRQETPFAIFHLWQEDQGFRKCRILNRAILESRGEYIVFLDADCILAKNFLQHHWQHREEGRYLGGRRVMINRNIAETVTMEMVQRGLFDHISLWALFHTVFGRIKYLEEALPILHRLRPNHPFNLLGCNFSIFKQDILAVNGFDEEYESRGGGEDTDIAFRLELTGRKMKSVRYLALQYHLGHEKSADKNTSLALFKAKASKLIDSERAIQITSIFSHRDRSEPGDP
ncbi:MAG: glycosyltransferase [Magnetococcus sp. DMHC-6]